MRQVIGLSILIFLVAACRPQSNYDMRPGMGMEPGGMSDRHHAQVPEEYADKKSPQVNDDMLITGAEIFETHCTSCHGDDGMGDGPAGSALNPAPAPIAHTSQMMSDDYLFWRTNNGGAEFSSAMPAWKDVLSDYEIWSVIAYIRALGSGEAAQIHTKQHEQMLAQAMEQNLISQEEADTFSIVHDAMDAYHEEPNNELPSESMDENQAFILEKLVKAGKITQSQADDFARIHKLLLDEGLMQ
jgi:mono/diheme cytochrome c family protein